MKQKRNQPYRQRYVEELASLFQVQKNWKRSGIKIVKLSSSCLQMPVMQKLYGKM